MEVGNHPCGVRPDGEVLPEKSGERDTSVLSIRGHPVD
jgi:hypothetical protein